jgi:hypothetical protein
MSMMNWSESALALVGQLWCACFSAAHRIEPPIGVVHGDKGSSHACRRLEKGAPAHAVVAR